MEKWAEWPAPGCVAVFHFLFQAYSVTRYRSVHIFTRRSIKSKNKGKIKS